MGPKNLEVDGITAALEERLLKNTAVGAPKVGTLPPSMNAVLLALVTSIGSSFRGRVGLQLEILALRHQLAVYHRRRPRTRTRLADRLLWAWLSRAWAERRAA